MRLRTCGAAAGIVVGALAVVAAPGAAQTSASLCTPGTGQYPPSECALTLSISAGLPGDPVQVRAGGYAAGSSVNIEFRSQPVSIGSATADASGTFTTTVRVPTDATVGTHTIAAVGINPDTTVREVTAQYIVLPRAGAPTQSGTGNLPRTGGGRTIPMTVAGAGLVAAGTVAVRAARGRRRAAA